MEETKAYIEACRAINIYIKNKKIDKKNLHVKLCLSKEEFNAIEEERYDISGAKLFEIAHALNTTVYDLLQEQNPKNNIEIGINIGYIIIFYEGDDYVVNKIDDDMVHCSKIDILNDCQIDDEVDHILFIDDIRKAEKSKLCVIIS